MTKKISSSINRNNLTLKYDRGIFSVTGASYNSFVDHKEIARKLKNKNPYTITVIIDNLNPKLWNNKKYVEKTKTQIISLYIELLYEYFFEEFGQNPGNELYSKWLDKYRPVWEKKKEGKELDDYIIENELEPRYRQKILKKYKNRESLFKHRTKIERKRYYTLPEPLNYVDWRNPYDNIFIWEENGKQYFLKGGSGSSGGRQTNSKFIFGFSLINKKFPVKSYLFLYSDNNRLYFIKKFPSLAIPHYDIGENYFLSRKEAEKILSGVKLLEWKSFNKVEEITIT